MKIPIPSIIATAAALAVAVAAAGPSPNHRRSVDCGNTEDTYERFMNCYNDRAVRCQPYADKSECFLANRGECGKSPWSLVYVKPRRGGRGLALTARAAADQSGCTVTES
ncbi:hypothetical protein DL767_003586 [Monosporascus sp. MG133]|nr:hypothetical protein DL767_003586 [Monosporascus sp. MG133]